MLLMSENTGDGDMTFYISGNLGADGGGTFTTGEFTEGYLKGFYSMTCNGHGNDPSVVSRSSLTSALLAAQVLLEHMN